MKEWGVFERYAALSILVAFAAGEACADAGDIEGSIEVGVEYDDNITIDSIDTTSRVGDSALRLSGTLGVELFEKGNTSLTTRYSFFQSKYQDLSDFNLQIHGLSARLKGKAGKMNLGANYRYDHIRLAGNEFMNVHTFGPDIGLLVAKKTYLTAGYEFRHQTFADPTRTERNADRHSLDGKLYFLLGKGRNITAGYKVSRQKANIDSLSYWGHTFDAGLKLPVQLMKKDTVFRLRYRYRQKDYSAVDTFIGDKRQDKRHTARAILEQPITDALELRLEYKYVSSISNLDTVDFNSNTVRASISWTF